MKIRLALKSDAEQIAKIYNQGIEDRIATFETTLKSLADIEALCNEVYPVVVVENHDEIAAFASSSAYRPSRACYIGVAEVSCYVERAFRGKGAGRIVTTALMEECTKKGFWKLVSRVFPENKISRKLLYSLGFREVGVYEKHSKLDNVWKDVVIVEYLIHKNII